ncbi:properdin [Patagioenas fasciata]|uniref:properdin n=1 Tax=Patagioenas fasciata TaxID=372321 RepID=UPI0032E92FD2
MEPMGLLVLLWVLSGTNASPPIWCFTPLAEPGRGGACAESLGDERVPLADCCLNPAYGYRLRPLGLCIPCRQDTWGPWGPWGDCSVTCGEGTQRRGRRRSPRGDNGDNGDNEDTREWQLRVCEMTPCAVGGVWSTWGPWGPCAATCQGAGPRAGRSRSRRCDWPEPEPSGPECEGNATQSETCTELPPCPQDGAWGAWSEAVPCAVTCGLGVVTLRRACDAPPPRYGGRGCPGNDTRKSVCGPRGACPALPEWGAWAPWSPCSRPQGEPLSCRPLVGQQRRSRACEGRSPGGPPCPTAPGDGAFQVRACYNVHHCLLSGNWSDWSPWGLCTPPCGASPTRSRVRECRPMHPNYPPTVTPVSSSVPVNVSFWGVPRPRCPLLDGQRLRLEETRPCLNVRPCPAPHED